MPTTAPATKTDRQMEDAMLAFAGDGERVHVLDAARAFKRSWIDLAEALTTVYERDSWQRWGFDSFDAYCAKELHLKKNTTLKLLGSYRFLATNAPKVITRTQEEPQAPVPSLKAVDFVQRAVKRAAAPPEVLREIETAAYEEGTDVPTLNRRFKEVAFPVDDAERKKRLRSQLANAARRLAGLIADPEAPVPHQIATDVEAALGQLLDSLDAA